jgi:P-type conjugative transfer protein TrbJ
MKKWLLNNAGKPPVLAVIALSVVSLVANTGSGGVVFDPTNFMKNTLTAMQTAQIAQTEVENLMISQLNLKGLGYSTFSNPQSVAQQAALGAAIGSLYGSLGNENEVLSNRYQQYSASNLSWQEYADRERRIAGDKKDRATVAFKRERQAMEDVNSQYAKVKELQGKTTATTGNLQALQTLNEHMNLVTAQNAQLLEHMSLEKLDKETVAVEDQGKKMEETEKANRMREAMQVTIDNAKASLK